MKFVSIIVLNYNNSFDTIECVKSLFELQYEFYQVIIIDNHSIDSSYREICDWVNKKFKKNDFSFLSEGEIENKFDNNVSLGKKIIVVRNNKNYGYAGGNNVGIKIALHNLNIEYVWILNNDTVVESNALKFLVNSFQANSNIGLCCSALYDYKKRSEIQAYSGRYFKITGTSKHLKYYDTKKLNKKLLFSEDYLIGASILIPVAIFHKIGLLTENFFLYSEDVDFSIRVKRDYLLYICKDSKVFHKEGGTSNRGEKKKSDISDFFYIKNKILLTRMHFMPFLPWILVSLIITLLNRILRGQFYRIPIIFKAIKNALNEKNL
jgi:GT2 family glycosyltransferase